MPLTRDEYGDRARTVDEAGKIADIEYCNALVTGGASNMIDVAQRV
jgi:hypothetical protein